jgi:hypothetical protein
MKKIKTVFITLSCEGKSFDYPQNLPLPRAGEIIIFENLRYIVTHITHIIGSVLADIKINCEKI